MLKNYSFITCWEVKAPLDKVWNTIYDSLEWPQWWGNVKKVVEIKPNDHNGINGIRAYTWKGALPYELSFAMRLTACEPMKRIRGIASGELEGVGEWTFTEDNEKVTIYYRWNVATTKKWMNTFGFLLKPFFIINHNMVMHLGAKGLAKKLGCTLIKG